MQSLCIGQTARRQVWLEHDYTARRSGKDSVPWDVSNLVMSMSKKAIENGHRNSVFSHVFPALAW